MYQSTQKWGDMSDLTGKVALVTGGSRGIGAAIALRLAASGADVVLTYARAKDRADEVVEQITARGGRGVAVEADNTDATAVVGAVERTVAEFGQLDVLVNNAGFFPFGVIDDVTVDEVDRALAVHARAVYLASQAAVRHMTDGGRVISIGSTLADRVPQPGVALYAMSKSALAGFTKGLARDVGARGITANVVHPGPTDTDMNPATGPGAAGQLATIALGHYGAASDVAGVVAFLAGPEGRHITGTAFTVDGGSNA